MSDMFNYLEAQAREENLPFRNAAAVAIDRAERRFGSFVESSQGDKEFNARLALVAEEIVKIANDTCEEYGYDDPQHIAKLVIGQLQILAEAKPEAGGEADEKQKLPTMPADGYYTEPTVALNPNSAGDHMKNTNPDIPELSPDDSQNPPDKEWPWDSPIPMEGDGLERTNVSDQRPEQKGPKTQTFPNKGQADPVTSSFLAEAADWSEDDESELMKDLDIDPGMLEPPAVSSDSLDDTEADWEDLWSAPDDPVESVPEEEDSWESVQEGMDAPYSRMSPMYQSRGLRRYEGPVQDASGLHSKNPYGQASVWDDRRNWKNYRDQQYRPAMAKAAAERMDFNALSELMTPSEAVDNLVSAGMPQHEAKDRIDFYVNHVDPGWAHKSWTSANKDLYEQLLEMDEPSEEELSAMPTQNVISEDEMMDLAAEEEAANAPQRGEDDNEPSLGDLYEEDAGDDFLNTTISSVKESLWDTTDPDLLEMSYEVGDVDPDQIAQVYRQYANSGRFETSQEAVDTLFAMYAENRPNAVDQIAQAFEQAIGLAPSNIEDVRQYAARFAKTKTADHPGVISDQIKMIKGVLERNVGRGGAPLSEKEKSQLQSELYRLMAQESSAKADYYTPGFNIDEKEEDRIKKMPLEEAQPLEDVTAPSTRNSPTTKNPVNYKMVSNIYQSFLKKQAKQ
jgi:hypothetical protein